jgi:hypothetical protein
VTDRNVAALLAVALFAVYNANGREIGSYDSQPTKYAAREFLLRGTLSLNHVVGLTPELAKRSAFVETTSGRYRSAYSPVAPLLAAAITWPFWKLGVIDIRAPLAPSLIAAVASSFLVSLAVAVLYLAARTVIPRKRALLLAIGLGVGTGFWTTASQTLWQHESVILGLALAVYGLMTIERAKWMGAVLVGIGCGVATASRLQVAPATVILVAATFALAGRRRGVLSGALVGAAVTPVLVTNYLWFGTVLGAAPLLERLHAGTHATFSSFRLQLDGLAGLLVSPNRGLLIFSPIAVVALLGFARAFRAGRGSPLLWITAASVAQFLLYAFYTVWWGGHTYGPRYMLDVLPLLVPAAALGMQALRGWPRLSLGYAALAWSIAVAMLGAFTYPHERWNSDPLDVDRTHERLWSWSDTQIARCAHAGPSPQNFTLFTRAAIRVPER